MPGGHLASECHTVEMMEEQERERLNLGERDGWEPGDGLANLRRAWEFLAQDGGVCQFPCRQRVGCVCAVELATMLDEAETRQPLMWTKEELREAREEAKRTGRALDWGQSR